MKPTAIIAGGGIGGLAAAGACMRAGWQAQLHERAEDFGELGAGVQLGPNVTRVMHEWGLAGGLRAVAAFPAALRVSSAHDNTPLGFMKLGEDFVRRYGAPYATIHRADLLGMMLALARHEGVDLKVSSPITSVLDTGDAVRARVADRYDLEGDALVAADGLWSRIRSHVCGDGAPVSSGHVAYRGLVAQKDLPQRMRSQDINVWLGSMLHVVAYPVLRGEELNVVAIVQGRARGSHQDWNQDAAEAQLYAAMQSSPVVNELVQAIGAWRMWALNDREPVQGAQQMARGRVALVGDSAHPMLPFFAQGAGMAIEDAAELGRMLATVPHAGADTPLALRRYAMNRWQRCARVQKRSRGNGDIFHATGFMQWGRDLAMRLLGDRLLDQPWLYGYGR